MAAASELLQQIEEAAEPVSQFWPMKGFVSHNPIMGLEHLPFDEASRQAKHLIGADAYLPNEEYRGFCRTGRITQRSIDRALERLGPRNEASISLGARTIAAAEVQRLHLVHGIDALEPALFEWQFHERGSFVATAPRRLAGCRPRRALAARAADTRAHRPASRRTRRAGRIRRGCEGRAAVSPRVERLDR